MELSYTVFCLCFFGICVAFPILLMPPNSWLIFLARNMTDECCRLINDLISNITILRMLVEIEAEAKSRKMMTVESEVNDNDRGKTIRAGCSNVVQIKIDLTCIYLYCWTTYRTHQGNRTLMYLCVLSFRDEFYSHISRNTFEFTKSSIDRQLELCSKCLLIFDIHYPII